MQTFVYLEGCKDREKVALGQVSPMWASFKGSKQNRLALNYFRKYRLTTFEREPNLQSTGPDAHT